MAHHLLKIRKAGSKSFVGGGRFMCATALMLAVTAAVEAPRRASAISFYWNGIDNSVAGGWSAAAAWSQSPSSQVGAGAPTSTDVATFNMTAITSTQTVNVSGTQSVAGIVYNSAGAVNISLAAGSSLTLGASGLTANSGAGQLLLVGATINLAASQTWTINSGNNPNVQSTLVLGTNTLTLAGSGSTGFSGPITGAGGINITGQATFLGSNNYSGSTAISGTLVCFNINSLGGTGPVSGTTINAGGDLELNGTAIGNESITVTGTGNGGFGAITNGSSLAASISGNITTVTSFSMGGSGPITLSGAITGSGGNSLTKIGNDTLTLSGTGDNTGLSLAISAGTVVLAKASGAGIHAVGLPVTVNNGTLRLGGTGGDQILDTAFVLVGSGGAFDTGGQNETLGTLSIQGTGSGAGALMDSSTSSVLTPSSTALMANSAIGVSSAGSALLLNNPVTGNFSLTKLGNGTLILNGTNTFTGGLSINSGTVVAGPPGALNATTPNAVTFGPGTGVLVFNSASLTVPSLTTNPAFISAVVQGPPTGAAALTINNAANNIFAGILQDGNASPGAAPLSVVKSGTGTLTLGGANSFSGTVSVAAGTLALANASALSNTAGVTVSSGATLDLGGQTVIIPPSAQLAIQGTGVGGNGALTSSGPIGGAAFIPGNITNSTFTVGGSGNISFGGFTSGTNVITKIGNNTLTLTGPLSDAGLSLTVNAGTVILAKAGSANAVSGSGISIAGGVVQLTSLAGIDQIADSANVTVSSGAFDTNGGNETINVLSLQGTGIAGTGALVDNGPGGLVSTLVTTSTVLTANAAIGVTNGGGTLALNNPISGNFSLTKVGAGTLILVAANTFTGGVTINGGTLVANASGALNSTVPNTVTFGPGGTGTLGLLSGNATVGGLSTDPTAGPTFVENLSSGVVTISVNNSVNNTFSGVLEDNQLGTGGLLQLFKSGGGTLVLSGANTFSGGMEIAAGTLQAGNPAALGNGSILIFAGGTLDLAGRTIASPAVISTGIAGGTITNSAATTATISCPVVGGGGPIGGAITVLGTGDINFSGAVQFGPLEQFGNNTVTLSGNADNSQLNAFVNSGTLVLAKTSPAHAINSGLTIAGGLAQIGGGNIPFGASTDEIADSAAVIVTTGAFDTDGYNETINSLALQGTGISGAGALLNSYAGASSLSATTVTLTGSTAIGVSQAAGTLSLNSPITGGFGLTKVGPGELILVGSVSGAITIAAGTLAIGGTGAGGGASLSTYGDIINNSNLLLEGGTVNGRLTNAGSLSFATNFTAGNGMENDSALSIPAGLIITLNGLGLDNEGVLTLSGGKLNLSTDGTANNINHGTFNLSASLPFSLGTATLANNGTFNLNAGSVIGAAGSLINGSAGTIAGTGSILSGFNNAGLVAVGAGTTNISQAWTNTGEAQLAFFTANLTGGAITNIGTIDGLGSVGSAVTNNGMIEAISGTLRLGGALTNVSNATYTGTLRSDAGAKILVTGSFPTNAGIVSLTGGTFDNNNQPLNNTGQITGYGTLSTGGAGLTNAGTITLTGGTTTVNGNITNLAAHNINIKFNPAIFTGAIINNLGATITTFSTTATFGGSFTNNGSFVTDPSTNIFQSNTLNGATGSMTGGVGDVFNFAGGTFSNSGTFTNGGTLQSAISISNSGTFIQSGPQIWAHGSTFSNSAGSATFSTDPGTSATRNLSIAITGGTVKLSGPQHLQSLTLASGSLDVSGDILLATASYSALAGSITSQAIFTSSAIPGTVPALLTGADFLAISPTGTCHGQTVLPTDTLLTVAYGGDSNLDDRINIDDYLQIDYAYENHLTNTTWINGDTNLNGSIDASDYAAIDTSYFRQSGPLADGEISLHTAEFGQAYTDAFAALNPSTIPEPGSLTLLGLGAAALLRRKRR